MRKKIFLCLWLFIIYFLCPFQLQGQKNNTTQKIKHQTSFSEYHHQVLKQDCFRMTELRSVAPNLKYDLKYATTDNFVGTRMYPAGTNTTFLRAPAASALKKVQDTLELEGLGLKIFDAYRPYAVTCHFWELIGDERYVANPSKGSGHNRGLAVDLTLIHLQTGQELDMGTGFDHFSDTAHHGFNGLNNAILLNRLKLKHTMEKYGFQAFETEWWHYSWPNDKGYPVMDLSFKQLQRKIR